MFKSLILMAFPKHTGTISMGYPFCVLWGQKLKFLNNDAFTSLKIVFIFANSADPDEMPPYVAFHLGLHCLPDGKYPFTMVSRMRRVRPEFLYLLIYEPSYCNFPESRKKIKFNI